MAFLGEKHHTHTLETLRESETPHSIYRRVVSRHLTRTRPCPLAAVHTTPESDTYTTPRGPREREREAARQRACGLPSTQIATPTHPSARARIQRPRHDGARGGHTHKRRRRAQRCTARNTKDNTVCMQHGPAGRLLTSTRRVHTACAHTPRAARAALTSAADDPLARPSASSTHHAAAAGRHGPIRDTGANSGRPSQQAGSPLLRDTPHMQLGSTLSQRACRWRWLSPPWAAVLAGPSVRCARAATRRRAPAHACASSRRCRPACRRKCRRPCLPGCCRSRRQGPDRAHRSARSGCPAPPAARLARSRAHWARARRCCWRSRA